MNVTTVSLETLHKLGGGVLGEAFDHELKACADDCEDRPMLRKDRTVTLSIKVQPNDSGDDLILSVNIDSKIPARQSQRFSVKRGPHALYHNQLGEGDLPGQTVAFQAVEGAEGTGTDG